MACRSGRIYMLTQWSVLKTGNHWFIEESTMVHLRNPHWRGPYASMEAACEQIARLNVKELTAREIGLEKWEIRL
jgi:hypothetical protein